MAPGQFRLRVPPLSWPNVRHLKVASNCINRSPRGVSMSQTPMKPNFRWETGYEKTWDAIKEDESGSLVTRLEQLVREAHSSLRQKRRHLALGNEAGHVRLGMMRHLFLIIDMSAAMLERDLRPSRILCTLRSATKFVEDFFDQNPTSQLGIITTSDTKAKRITELSGSPARHLTALDDLAKQQCSGESSLQNALMLAESRLKHMPEHSSREIIILVGSLTTCDPGDIHQTIQSLIVKHIHCSVISLAVEVFIHKALAESTQGSMHVILDALHLKTVLQDFVPPPVAKEDTEATLIRIGFPHSRPSDFDEFPVKHCMCHLPSTQLGGDAPSSSTTSSVGPLKSSASYACPRCRAVYCELPTECTVCGTTLVAAPHLARAYHHLFPLPTFREETVPPDNAGETVCTSCAVVLRPKALFYRCPRCSNIFCPDCDNFLHDSVHSCPTCAP